MALRGPGRRHRLPEDQVLDRRQQDPRHGQQLRQRLHALGHLPHLRGELGRLLPPRRRDRQRRTAAPKELASFTRYGVAGTGRELWATVDARHRRQPLRPLERRSASAPPPADDFRNGANTYGWVVEIDPFDAGHARRRSAPRWAASATKAPGLGPVVAGKPLVWYMGDDSRNEYIYKFVSTTAWDAADATRRHGGRRQVPGRRQALRRASSTPTAPAPGSSSRSASTASPPATRPMPSPTRPTCCVNTRLAADAAGATKMDRPEWTAVESEERRGLPDAHQHQRTARPVGAHRRRQPALLQRPEGRGADGADGQSQRPHHPLRRSRRRPGGHHLHLGHLPVRRARPRAAADVNLSGLVADNDFSSPDGMWFSAGDAGPAVDPDRRRRLHRRHQLHDAGGAAGQGRRRRGRRPSPTSTARPARRRRPSSARRRARTACAASWSARRTARSPASPNRGDGRALFVNIQHPGETTPAGNIGDPTQVRQPLAGRRHVRARARPPWSSPRTTAA